MRVSILGCGQFSRMHINAIKKIEGLEVVAVCDQDQWRAKEVAGLAGEARAYNDFAALLEREHPDTVHILTPPDTHASLSIKAMQAGCHVLVEKPMALSVQEADRMNAVARESGVKLGTDHNYLFNPCIIKARQLVEYGEIGQVVYVDSYYGLSEAGSSYTSIAGRSHWAWRLPGSAFTNFLPHLIYLQVAFLPGPIAVAGVTLSRGDQPDTPPTELTVLLEGCNASGVMAISMRAKPYAKYINIYGTNGMIHADLATEVCTLHKSHRLPGMITKVLYNLEESVQLASGTTLNTAKVFLGMMKSNPGLYNHLREFYAGLRENQDIPVSGEDGRKMIEIMEQVWTKSGQRFASPAIVRTLPTSVDPKTAAERKFTEAGIPGKILVTGATGFLGYHLVNTLSRCGANVVAFVHNKDRVSSDLEQRAEIVCGDLRDPLSIDAAMRGARIVFHCAAITNNNVPWEYHHDVNIIGSEMVFKAALKTQVERVIHVSSVIVYGLSSPPKPVLIGESYSYPQNQDQWAYYLRSKREGDRLALSYYQEADLPVTILRLGILYGPGSGRSITRGLLQLGPIRLTIGEGRNVLPFTYVGNAVDCMLLASVTPDAIGQAYNVVDEPQVSVRDAMKKNTEITGERMTLIPLPPFLLSGAASLLEWRSKYHFIQTPPKLSNFVVRSACRNLRYDTKKSMGQLGWHPEVTLEDGLKRTYLNLEK